jgi:predicted Zn-ribbon and HTH transcriptional regulator
VISDEDLAAAQSAIARSYRSRIAELTRERDEARSNIRVGRLTCDISKDLRDRAAEPLGPLAFEAADQLDELITSLAKAETERDERLVLADKICGDCDTAPRMVIDNVTITYCCPECHAADDVQIDAPTPVGGSAARSNETGPSVAGRAEFRPCLTKHESGHPIGQPIHCYRSKGHDGDHQGGGLSWPVDP